MPSGNKHREINTYIIFILLITAIIAYYFNINKINPFFFIGILISTYYMNGDNDTPGARSDKGMGVLWDWYWNLYSKWFKHRGISHSITLGTFSRLLYILPLVILFTTILPAIIKANLVRINLFINK